MALVKELTFLLKEESTSLNFILAGVPADGATTISKIVFLPTKTF
jgi:hypothetical protein